MDVSWGGVTGDKMMMSPAAAGDIIILSDFRSQNKLNRNMK